jgi:hypothetical protein
MLESCFLVVVFFWVVFFFAFDLYSGFWGGQRDGGGTRYCLWRSFVQIPSTPFDGTEDMQQKRQFFPFYRLIVWWTKAL